jgi:hypothetical protein
MSFTYDIYSHDTSFQQSGECKRNNDWALELPKMAAPERPKTNSPTISFFLLPFGLS